MDPTFRWAFVGLGTAVGIGATLFVLEAVPIDLGLCGDSGMYRAHFAVRLCEYDAERHPDFRCTHRLAHDLGWFAPADRVCEEGRRIPEPWLGWR